MSASTISTTAVACLGTEPAPADRDCRVPLADWQPREALQKKLEAEGWTVMSIRTDVARRRRPR
ncbi:PepSY domain-containing protein [Xanthobacter sp. DSM 24535]|uniref:PepSY domain-containing protein n=1 Tax=Roseixanthobacter psychrophilus TaxID=3119917 RepID=UPI0037289600